MEQSAEIKRLKSKLSIEVMWLYILKLLKEKPLHAYAIRKKVVEKFGFLPGNVTAYVVLYKLETRGFVEAEQEENKKVYSITPAGKRLFDAGKLEWGNRSKQLFG